MIHELNRNDSSEMQFVIKFNNSDSNAEIVLVLNLN